MGRPRERSIGRYELLIELARGGMAELFVGRLRGAGGFEKLVAIKRILPHLAQDRQFTEMFLNEGRIAAQLAHPNVCQVFELDEVGGELFLAMEYLDGASWQHLIEALPPGVLAMRVMAGVLAQAADGLHYAHTLRDALGRPTPVVHRDVSPQNLFVTVDGVCKVLDFGVSKMTKDSTHTRSGVIKGKLPYMAPEQIRGDELDGRSDVFSLGVCAWEALTAKRLFDRETDYQIWKAITEEDVPPVTAHWPDCPPALDAAIRRALDRDPARRQATARELADDLRGNAGMASLGEIADAVRTRCADRIAARAHQMATAIGDRVIEPAGSATIVEDAGETVDFRAQARSAAPPGAEMQLRDASIAVRRSSGPDLRALPGDDLPAAAPGRGRSHLATAAIAAAVAALVTAIVVVVVLGRRSAAPATPDARSGLPGLDEGMARIEAARDTLTGVRDQLQDLGKVATDTATELAPSPPPDAAVAKSAPPDRSASPKSPARRHPTKTAPAEPPASAEPGFYNVDSKPYATIYADGKRLGETPLRAPLPPGKHAIRAVLADQRERSFTIEIASGKDETGKLAW